MESMSETLDKLGAHDVAAWLRRHPTFLKQFPDLALSMVVPRDDGPTASLASYQLEVLRDKNRELSRRLNDLFANAQENERLAVRTHQLALTLMKQATAADTVRAMAASLAEDFNGDRVSIVLLQPVAGLEESEWLLYGARAEEVASSALLPLPGIGLVAVGSRDGNRFYPGMGTLFLRMMGDTLVTALKRFDG
jgi:uncharacterized protein YigA (DUF484 family)